MPVAEGWYSYPMAVRCLPPSLRRQALPKLTLLRYILFTTATDVCVGTPCAGSGATTCHTVLWHMSYEEVPAMRLFTGTQPRLLPCRSGMLVTADRAPQQASAHLLVSTTVCKR